MHNKEKSEILTIGIPAVVESLFAAVVTSIDTQMISPLGKGAVSSVAHPCGRRIVGRGGHTAQLLPDRRSLGLAET